MMRVLSRLPDSSIFGLHVCKLHVPEILGPLSLTSPVTLPNLSPIHCGPKGYRASPIARPYWAIQSSNDGFESAER